MTPHLAATITFVVATTFSPGPNNLVAAALGMLGGYRRALRFTLGVFCGFVVVMLVCALAATMLLERLPTIEPALKYIGAVYVLYLAGVIWFRRGAFGRGAEPTVVQGWRGGFVLQFVNPKLAVYGLMLYSAFLADLAEDTLHLVLSTVALALVSFASVTTWALAGATIRRWLTSDRARAIAAGVLALSLVWSALELVGIRNFV